MGLFDRLKATKKAFWNTPERHDNYDTGELKLVPLLKNKGDRSDHGRSKETSQ